MNAIGRILCVAAICGIGAPGTALGDDASGLFAKAKNSVVLIVSQDGNQTPLAIGSGFFFRAKYIATNYHVVQGASSFKIRVIGDNAKINNAHVKSYSEALDLAILETDQEGTPLTLSTGKDIEIGQRVLAIGNPRGLIGTASEGIVSGIRELDGLRIYQITSPISPGSSGGPVLVTSGEVLGIATFTLSDSQNLNFAMPASLLLELEQKNMKWEPAKARAPLYKKGNAGVELVLFQKKGSSFQESFSLKNTTKNAIRNLTIVLLYRTLKGEVFDFRLTAVPDLIPPGLAKMITERSFDQQQRFSYRGEKAYLEDLYDRFDVELRILSYDIVEQDSIADKLLDKELKDTR